MFGGCMTWHDMKERIIIKAHELHITTCVEEEEE